MNTATTTSGEDKIDPAIINLPDKIDDPSKEPDENQAVRYMDRIRALIAFATKDCLKEASDVPADTAKEFERLAENVCKQISMVEIGIFSQSVLSDPELDTECFIDNELFEVAERLEEAVNEHRAREKEKAGKTLVVTRRFRLADLRSWAA